MNTCGRTLSLALLTAIAATGLPAVAAAETSVLVERGHLPSYIGCCDSEPSTLPIQVNAAAIDSAVKTQKFPAVKPLPKPSSSGNSEGLSFVKIPQAPTEKKRSEGDDSEMLMLKAFPGATIQHEKPFDEWWSRWSIDDQLRTLELRYFVATGAVPLADVKAADLDQIFRVPEQIIDQGSLPLLGGSTQWILTRKERHICSRFVWNAQDKARQILGAYCVSSKMVPDGAAMLQALDFRFGG